MTIHIVTSLTYGMLPYYVSPKRHIHSFGEMLEPRYIIGTGSLDQ